MEDREFTFEQIAGENVSMISFDEESFSFADDYMWLWEQMKPLVEGSFDFDSWTNETEDEYGNYIKIQLKIKDTSWPIELERQMGFFDSTFIDKLNEIIEALHLSGNRFRDVCPTGIDVNSFNNYIVFLSKEVVEKLNENGYGKWDKKWIGL